MSDDAKPPVSTRACPSCRTGVQWAKAGELDQTYPPYVPCTIWTCDTCWRVDWVPNKLWGKS